MAYIETPRTDAGNLTIGQDIEGLSIEDSFLSPLKRQRSIPADRIGKTGKLDAARSRTPFTDRRNFPTLRQDGAQAEFTPLLKSVAKKNLLLGKENALPQTPAFLRNGINSNQSPALPAAESSVLYGDDTVSSMNGNGTPAPQVSSSAQSTPLAVPRGEGVLTEQGNILTLREQESIINKIEKENFGLKLKIHFLEESLRKNAPGLNETALKENAELKVDKITVQKELLRTRKILTQAEKNLEQYRLHLQEEQGKAELRHADEGLREELESLRHEVQSKDIEIMDLKRRLEKTGIVENELEQLHHEADDIASDLRDRERRIEEQEDEIENLKEESKAASREVVELQEQLKEANHDAQDAMDWQQTIDELQDDLETAKAEIQRGKGHLDEAVEQRQKAEDDLHELREEMSNKSFDSKGLSRQLEAKVIKLQDDLNALRQEHSALQSTNDNREQEIHRLEKELSERQQEEEIQMQRLQDECTRLRALAHTALPQQLLTKTEELNHKSEEKDLLQSRHEALTRESQALQRDLHTTQRHLEDLKQDLQEEKDQAVANDRLLRLQAKDETNRLARNIDRLHESLQEQRGQMTIAERKWEDERHNLNIQKATFEDQANDLQQTVLKLQEGEGVILSHKIKRLETLESEKERYLHKETALVNQVADLRKAVQDKEAYLQKIQAELSDTRESLRLSSCKINDYQVQVEALEDEIAVLQGNFDNELRAARSRIQDLEDHRRGSQPARQADSPVKKGSTMRQGLEKPLSEMDVQNDEASERWRGLKEAEVIDQTAFSGKDPTKQMPERPKGNLPDLVILRRELGAARQEAAESLQREAPLRNRIEKLERDLANTRAIHDRTMVEERKDLHGMLKDAKLEAEDMHAQVNENEKMMRAASKRESDLRVQLKRLREERNSQAQRRTAVVDEFEHLQRRYERAVIHLKEQQQKWEEERRSIMSHVRFPNVSISSPDLARGHSDSRSLEASTQEKRHQGELRGLAQQIHWLRAKCTREEGFRAGLAYEKKFLLLQIDMYSACNKTNLHMLEELDVVSDKAVREKRPNMRWVGLVVIASIRLRRLQEAWSKKKRLHTSIRSKAEQVRRSSSRAKPPDLND